MLVKVKVGDPVICINDDFHADVQKFYTALPKRGQTYKVRGIEMGISPTGHSEVAIMLDGLDNPKSTKPPFPERGFSNKRFLAATPETSAMRFDKISFGDGVTCV